MIRIVSTLLALSMAPALLLTSPADASPYDWRSYPNGGRTVSVALAPDWLLLDAERPSTTAIENIIGKVAPGATLARVMPLVGPRTALEIGGADVETLREIGAALTEAEVAPRFWPAWARGEGRGFFDDRLAVRVTHDGAVKILPELGVRVLAPSYLDGVWWAEAMDGDAIGAAWRLEGRPGIVWATPDLIRDAKTTALTDDPRIGEQWHLGDGSRPGSINAAAAWEVTKGSPDIIVGIFDNGFDTDHPDLVDNWVGGFDRSDNDDDPSSECTGSQDGLGPAASCPGDRPFRESHGTAVAGVAVGRGDNQLLGAGVCPLCSLYTVRYLGEGSFRSLGSAETFQRATDEGVDVINNSWGPSITRFFPLGVAEREVFHEITTNGREGKGVVILFAAGNDGFTPATANPYASNPGSVTVAASTRVDDFACYSNYGDVIAIAAPSQGCFDGEDGIGTTDYVGAEGYSPGDFTNGFGGTSAASPVAAGLAGLILSANPELTAQQVRLVMQTTAEKIRADKNDWNRLFGGNVDLAEEFDYDENGFSPGFGYGRIDAARAVNAALEPPQTAGSCGEGCPRCIDDRCVTDCAVDTDCPGATRCFEQSDGALGCALPVPAPTDVGQPCVAECDACVGAYDENFAENRVCTTQCENDDDCPFGFDCRTVDPMAPRLCVPGNQECGEPFQDVRCQSSVAVQDGGTAFCSCPCFGDDPGSCPDGFVCSNVECRQQRGAIICDPVNGRGNYFPHCVPDPNAPREIPCEEHGDCASGLFCIDGLCEADREDGGCDTCVGCSSDDECSAGSECVETTRGRKCMKPCEYRGPEGQCPADTVCANLPGPVGDYCTNPDYATKGYCPRAWRCMEENRCFGDDDCEDGVACGEDRWCEVEEPEPDMMVVDAEVPDAEVPDASPDMGITVLEGDASGQSSGCAVAPGADGRPLPAAVALLLVVLAIRRR